MDRSASLNLASSTIIEEIPWHGTTSVFGAEGNI